MTTLTFMQFHDSVKNQTAAIIFGLPFLLVHQKGRLDDNGECTLEFKAIAIVNEEDKPLISR